MLIVDILSVIANISTAVAVVIGVWQLVLAQRQNITNFEDSFAKEYRNLISKMPTKALLGESLSEEEHIQYIDEMYHYFDLCNEQIFLHNAGRISDQTWIFWKDGITSNLRRPAFDRAWAEIAWRANGDFSELKTLAPPRQNSAKQIK